MIYSRAWMYHCGLHTDPYSKHWSTLRYQVVEKADLRVLHVFKLV